MSNPRTSGALVPSNQSNTSFAQQGSLDWVALGQMQYSTTIAVLGRLAKAGIDPITVAFGQAMCSRIPIGPHGEKVLARAMSSLNAKSTAGDLIWFGTGVRHILRELVQTSPGCALVALCAALAEGQSISVTALVLWDIAKHCGGPREITPSLEQWEVLARVTSSVFNTTTFGLRVHQIAKFGRTVNMDAWPSNSHPSDLASILLSIGQIVLGNLQTISVQGGCSCSWVAAWADFVLGLRVLVRDTNGDVVYANYNTEQSFAQVVVSFMSQVSDSSLIHTSHLVRSGTHFIQECFGRERLWVQPDPDIVFSPGRLQKDTMLSDTFGESFQSLLRPETTEFSDANPELPPLAGIELRTKHQLFIHIISIAAIILVGRHDTGSPLAVGETFMLRACENIPELNQCRRSLFVELQRLTTGNNSIDLDALKLHHKYSRAMDRLGHLCLCKDHCPLNSAGNEYCLVAVVDTITFLAFLLSRLVMDAPLLPTAFGLHCLYHMSTVSRNRNNPFFEHAPTNQSQSTGDISKTSESIRTVYNALTRHAESSCSALFTPLSVLFSSQRSTQTLLHKDIARSNGKFYCYTHLLEELTDDAERASLIHIGSGSMEYHSRPHNSLFDGIGDSRPLPKYAAQSAEVVSSIDHLSQDTTSVMIEAQPLVEEWPKALYFNYQITSSSGRALIAPTTLLENLARSVAYKLAPRFGPDAEWTWSPVLQGFNYILVHGEGLAEESNKCHVLRALRGNILGRCVAISCLPRYAALVKTKEDLETFARFWAKYRDECHADQHPPHYYVLIS